MVVTTGETSVDGWPVPEEKTSVVKKVEVKVVGREFPPPLAEEIGVPVPEVEFDAWIVLG